MHRFPKIFSSSDKKAAGGGGSSSGGGSGRIDSNFKQKKPRPRLDRRNAKKNIDYELPSTSSASSASSSDDYLFSPTSALDSPATPVSAHRSRSIDNIQSFDKLTSFRIQGNCPGEFEIICKSLGLSGPEDFCIPAEAWEDMKVRSSSSDVLPRLSRFNYDGGGGGSGHEINLETGNTGLKDKTRRVSDVISLKTGSPDFGSSPDSTPSPRVKDVINGNIEGGAVHVLETAATPPVRCSNEILSSDKLGFDSRPGGCSRVSESNNRLGCSSSEALLAKNERGGDLVSNEHVVGVQGIGCSIIKGARPPPLAPPPAMSLPPIDRVCSTWDLLKSFAPDDNEGTSRFEVSEDEDSAKRDEDKGEDEDEDEEVVHYAVESRRAGGESGLLSESCSFTTSNDDDSSSTTTEPLSNISPNARFSSPNTRFNSPNGTFKRIISYWEKGELLGRGSFGSVYEGIADGGFFFAVKEVSLLDQGEEAQQSIYQLEQEIALLSQFEHENIVKYYGTDKDDSKLYIFLELVTKGSLLSLYQKYHLQDSMVSAYTRQILHGLKYLHDRNVVHRDIKCANILVDANGYVKLADFGLAKATKLNDVKSCKGTALWMAPEVVNRRNKGYGLAADIWSLGCTVLEMLTRQFPYSHLESQMQALFRIGKGERPRVPDTLSRDARDFILQCLQVNPNARPAASQLLNHPFVQQRSPPFSSPASPYHPSRRV